jgi:hypothetical protein
MRLKDRYRIGFRLGKLEHQTRYLAIKILIIGVLILGGGYYWWNKLVVLISLIIIGISAILELLSLIFHIFEKKTLNNIRHSHSLRRAKDTVEL